MSNTSVCYYQFAMPLRGDTKLSLGLGLLALAGAGAMSAFPSQRWIGLSLIIISFVWMVWLACYHYSIDNNRMIPFTGMILCIAGAVAFGTWYFWPNRIAPVQPAKTQERLKVPVTDIEMQTMREIDNWIGVLDENGLRNVFDITGVLAHNLNFISKNKGPYDGTQLIAETVILDPRRMKWYKEPDGRGRYQIPPGTVSLLFTTKAYEDAKSRLDQYARSAYLSDQTRAAIKELSGVIVKNMYLMIDVLDQELESNPEAIIDYKKKASPYFGVVLNRYMDLYYPLRPAAEKINRAIRARLSDYQ